MSTATSLTPALQPPVSIESLLGRRSDLWRGRARGRAVPEGVPTGHQALDRELPWGGWPPGSLIELLAGHPGDGLGLVVPALARLSTGLRWVLLVDPPWHPFAPALAARGLALERLVVAEAGERLAWGAEQGLRSGACSAVLVWGGRWEGAALRRLQLAAQDGDALGFLFRDAAAARNPSPAPLRLRVAGIGAGYRVEVLKQRGAPPGAVMDLGLATSP